MEWIGLREEQGVNVFDGWVSPAVIAGRKRPESVSLTPYEHNVSQAGESSVRPQDEDQPMNPDDVQALEEVGDDEAIPATALPSPTQPTLKEIQEHELTHLPPRSWCRHCLRGRGTSLPHFRSETEGERTIPK